MQKFNRSKSLWTDTSYHCNTIIGIMPDRFNIRVYFLLIQENKILVSDEIIKGKPYTKFPGGGLEFGEGTVDCIKREAFEELHQEVDVLDHFYTTDFFIQSAFRENDQVVCIYYKVALIEKQQFKTSHKKFDFTQTEKDEESFRWVKFSDLASELFSFPGDVAAVKQLINKLR